MAEPRARAPAHADPGWPPVGMDDVAAIVETVGVDLRTAVLPEDRGSPQRTHVFVFDKVVVKLDKEDGRRIDREAAALALLADSTLPVPRLLATGRLAYGRPWIVMTRLPGREAPDAGAAGHLVSPAVARQLGELAARLHREVEPPAFGSWTVRPTSLVDDDADRAERLLDLAFRNRFAEADEIRALGDLLDRTRGTLATAPTNPVLVHRDLQQRNVLLSPEGTVVALLDFESAAGGDPAEDFNRFGLDWTAAGPQAFAASYQEAGGAVDDAFAERVAHHTLQWALVVFAYVGGLVPELLPVARTTISRIRSGERPDIGA